MTAKITQVIDHLFRHESGKMVAVLSRLLGLQQIGTAQDIVQDTLLQAMHTWAFNGIPENPPAWLHRVAKNKAIDHLRRQKKFREIRNDYELQQSATGVTSVVQSFFLENEIQDSQLSMMFACCHPSIPPESQVALTMKTLCGLSVHEIARAFLTHPDTISKRIYRAREKIREEKIELEVPTGRELQPRIDAVLQSLYLLFNEGYNSSHPEKLIREDLCHEAIRLAELLDKHPLTATSRTKALLALMYFQGSRLGARLDDASNIILLKLQNRRRWDRAMIQKGFDFLQLAAEPFEQGKSVGDITTYHIEAAIASMHAASPSFERTDWRSIYHLYEALYQLQPNPFVALNKAIASAYAISKEKALEELYAINGLEDHHIYNASIGEMYFDLAMKEEARRFFQKAMTLTDSTPERQLLEEKIRLC